LQLKLLYVLNVVIVVVMQRKEAFTSFANFACELAET